MTSPKIPATRPARKDDLAELSPEHAAVIDAFNAAVRELLDAGINHVTIFQLLLITLPAWGARNGIEPEYMRIFMRGVADETDSPVTITQ